MARILALEWNETEARAAVAAAHGERVVLEQAFTIALTAKSAENDVGQQIAAALAERRLGRLDALVGVGRSSVELRQMSLPPVPDEELPEVVRFQALREFSAVDEDWPLDFFPLDDDPTQSRSVLASAASPQLIGEIRQVCDASELKLTRLTLRPASAASLVVRRQSQTAAEVRLLVDLLAGEADLTVLVGRKVAFLRCARLSGDPLTEARQVLLSELRLTMAAASNQLSGRKVESVVLFGSGALHAALASAIEEQLGLPTELFDPFEGQELEGPLRRSLPEHPGRFASLLGMLSDELTHSPHAFDFLHPRRRPEPPSRRNSYALAGLAAGLVVLLLVFARWYQRSLLIDELQRLQSESKLLDKKVTQAAKLEKDAAEIDRWLSTDVIWLDEFRWLSEKFPTAEDAMLVQLKMNSGTDGAEMVFDGLARNVDAVTRLDGGLHDERHRVAGKSKGDHEAGKQYGVQFRSSLLVTPEQRPGEANAAKQPSGNQSIKSSKGNKRMEEH
jgi:Tfp pilus assembly PilM family ATPase